MTQDLVAAVRNGLSVRQRRLGIFANRLCIDNLLIDVARHAHQRSLRLSVLLRQSSLRRQCSRQLYRQNAIVGTTTCHREPAAQ